MRRAWLLAASLCLIVGIAPFASAQDQDQNPASAARFHFGPLGVTPSITITNLGIDNNVFNEAVDPKQDTTGTVGPTADIWLKLGRSRVVGTIGGQYLYFYKYADQRALNTVDSLRWELPLARITPAISGTYSNTKDRSGYEIVARTRQSMDSVTLSTDIRVSSKMNLVIGGTMAETKFADDATFLGTDLASALNHTNQSEQLQLRYKLTSLTTLVVAADGSQDRFSGNPLRNSNSIRILPGFEFKPAALISGTVLIGFRRFEPLDPSLPPSNGLNAAVNAKYSLRATQVAVGLTRDVSYSFQAEQPFYALTDMGLSITQRLNYAWDVVVKGSRQTLDYQQVQSSVPLGGDTDTIRQLGGGIGYRVGRTMRLGLDGTYYRRSSPNVLLGSYEGLRVGLSASYGLPQ